MKKLSKTVVVSLTLTMVIAGLIPAVNAEEEKYTVDQQVYRVSGSDRIETAIKISEKFNKSENVILATSGSYADALVSAPLANKLNAPILLNKPSSLDSRVKSEIRRLEAKNVYIVGGEASLSEGVEDELRLTGLNVRRISGANRYETCVNISKEYGNYVVPNKVIIASGENFPDALVAGPYASYSNAPILLSTKNSLPAVVKEEVERINPLRVIAIGGKSSLYPDNVNISERISGKNRFETSYNVSRLMDDKMVFVTNGLIFADALVAAPLASKTNSPILLREKYRVQSDVAGVIDKAEKVVIVGGFNSVSDGSASKEPVIKNNPVQNNNVKMKKEDIESFFKDIEKSFNELINEHRANNGRNPLKIKESARDGGQLRAKEIIQRFSHTRPNDERFFTAFSNTKPMGENIVYVYATGGDKKNFAYNMAKKAFDMWKNSPGHNKNMLKSIAEYHILGMAYNEKNNAIYLADNFFWSDNLGNIGEDEIGDVNNPYNGLPLEEIMASFNDLEDNFNRLINEYRINNNLGILKVQEKAKSGADMRAETISHKPGYFNGNDVFPGLGHINENMATYNVSLARKNHIGEDVANFIFDTMKNNAGTRALMLNKEAKEHKLGIYFDKRTGNFYIADEFFRDENSVNPGEETSQE